MAESADVTPSYDELWMRLQRAEQTLEAIHRGEVDALMVSTPNGMQVYTLQGADEFYRALVEQMGEGAVAVESDGTVLFANQAMARMLDQPLEVLVGANINTLVQASDHAVLAELLDPQSTVTDATLTLGFDGAKTVVVAMSAREVAIRSGDTTMCLIAVDQTQNLRAEEALRAAERAERAAVVAQRREFLAEISDALASTIDAEEAMRRLARLVVPRLADWAILTATDEDGRVRAVASAHRDPLIEPDVARYAIARLAVMSTESPAAVGLRTTQPIVLSEFSDAALSAAVADRAVADMARRLRPHGVVVLPLVARGRTFAELTLVTTTERGPHTDDELATAFELAVRAGPALDSTQAGQRARRLAESMQRSLLSVAAPGEGLQVATRYRPAYVDREVGGDWFDLFRLPDGSTVVSIGDVMGHDLAAMAGMAQLRTLMRAAAWTLGHSPGQVLAATDNANFGLGLKAFATAITAELRTPDPDGSILLTWSNAGHMPPLVIGPDGNVTALVGSSVNIPLGVRSPTARDDHSIVLAPGSVVLLYTDGLIERRDRGIDSGLDALMNVLDCRHNDDLEELLDDVLAELSPEDLHDDVAMLAVRVTDTTLRSPGLTRVVELPADLSAPATARGYVARLAGALPERVLDDAVLLTSELVTNAVRHGAPPIRLTVETVPDGVAISVHDGGVGLPVLVDGHGDLSASGGRGLHIVASIADDWGWSTPEPGAGKSVWCRLVQHPAAAEQPGARDS